MSSNDNWQAAPPLVTLCLIILKLCTSARQHQTKKIQRCLTEMKPCSHAPQWHKLLQINGMPDHVHLFFGMRPDQSLSELMQKVKGDSSRWINKNQFIPYKFSWQEGFGGFSYSKSQVSTVINYIQNQKKHHKKKTFIEEYKDFLRAFEIEHDEKYIFKPVQW